MKEYIECRLMFLLEYSVVAVKKGSQIKYEINAQMTRSLTSYLCVNKCAEAHIEANT